GAVRPRRRRGTLGRPGPPPVRFLGCSASPMCAFGRDLDGSGRSVDGRGRPPVRAAGPTPGGGGGVSEPVIKIGAVWPGCVTTGGHQMIIDRRFHGPEGSGNGGYVAGRLAGRVPIDTVTVRLRQPPPLDTELTV